MNLTEQNSDSKEKDQNIFKLVWGITGAGDILPETFEIMNKIKGLKKNYTLEITVILSQAAVKVVKMYRLWTTLEKIADVILPEKDANTPFIVGSLQIGKYDALLVSPTTSNSVAKIVHGISDTLITNSVSMTNRTKTPIFILPVEKRGNEVRTTLPDGSKLELLTRDLDAENTEKLCKMKGITVLDSPKDIQRVIEHLERA